MINTSKKKSIPSVSEAPSTGLAAAMSDGTAETHNLSAIIRNSTIVFQSSIVVYPAAVSLPKIRETKK